MLVVGPAVLLQLLLFVLSILYDNITQHVHQRNNDIISKKYKIILQSTYFQHQTKISSGISIVRAWYLCSISNICALPSHKSVIYYRYIFGIKNISFLGMPIGLDGEIRILKVYAFTDVVYII